MGTFGKLLNLYRIKIPKMRFLYISTKHIQIVAHLIALALLLEVMNFSKLNHNDRGMGYKYIAQIWREDYLWI